MKKHKFNQEEILNKSNGLSNSYRSAKFANFLSVAKDLGFKVTKTKGRFLTHEINTSEDEFSVLLDLI